MSPMSRGKASHRFDRRLIFMLASLVLLAGCRIVPETGRRQLILVSTRDELQMGEKAYAEVLEKSTLSSNGEAVKVLHKVGTRIAVVAGKPLFDWEFNLIESEQQNAFCLPGGKVAAYTGILPAARTEGGLATIVSHEIAHAIAHHGAERVSQHMLAQFGSIVIAVAMDGKNEEKKNMVLAAYGLGATVGVLLPYSRTQELEADRIGLKLMAKAGYDPHAAVEFWRDFAEAKAGGSPAEFLSTHPTGRRRIDQLERFLPEALEDYRNAPEKFSTSAPLPE